jgi:hypothetical protein
MVKKTKLQSYADEIAKLERNVKRRFNQLEKEGKKTKKPSHTKPKTVKEAKQMIFEMESYLRHNSKNASVRMGAKRGKEIKKGYQIEADYKQAKKLRKLAHEAFTRSLKNPINKELEKKGSRTLDFEEFTKQFDIGSSPNEYKTKIAKQELANMYKKDAMFLKNHPTNAGEQFVESKISEYKRFVLEQLSKSSDDDQYADAMDMILKMNSKQFMLWFDSNENALEELKHRYTNVSIHHDDIESTTQSLFESLGVDNNA